MYTCMFHCNLSLTEQMIMRNFKETGCQVCSGKASLWNQRDGQAVVFRSIQEIEYFSFSADNHRYCFINAECYLQGSYRGVEVDPLMRAVSKMRRKFQNALIRKLQIHATDEHRNNTRSNSSWSEINMNLLSCCLRSGSVLSLNNPHRVPAHHRERWLRSYYPRGENREAFLPLHTCACSSHQHWPLMGMRNDSVTGPTASLPGSWPPTPPGVVLWQVFGWVL